MGRESTKMFPSTKQGSCGQLDSCQCHTAFPLKTHHPSPNYRPLPSTAPVHCDPEGWFLRHPITVMLPQWLEVSRRCAQYKHIQGSCQIHGTMLGQAYVFSLPQMLRLFSKNRASPAPHSPNFLQRSSLMAAREVQSLPPSRAINNIWLQMLPFKFSSFMLRKRKGPFRKEEEKKVSWQNRLWQIYYYLSW